MGAATPRPTRTELFPDRRLADAETDGNSLSLRCLVAAIDASGVERKVLAEELDVSEGEFSKLCAGRMRLTHTDRLRIGIQRDWRRRMDAEDPPDPVLRRKLKIRRLRTAIDEVLDDDVDDLRLR